MCVCVCARVQPATSVSSKSQWRSRNWAYGYFKKCKDFSIKNFQIFERLWLSRRFSSFTCLSVSYEQHVDEEVYETLVEWCWQGRTELLGKWKGRPNAIFLTDNSQWLTWSWKYAFAVRERKQILYIFYLFIHLFRISQGIQNAFIRKTNRRMLFLVHLRTIRNTENGYTVRKECIAFRLGGTSYYHYTTQTNETHNFLN